MSVTHFLIIYNSNNSRYAVSFKVQCIMLPIYLGMYIDRPLLGFIKELKDRIDFKIYDRQMENKLNSTNQSEVPMYRFLPHTSIQSS